MKKISVLLFVTVMAFSLAACGSGSGESSGSDKESTNSAAEEDTSSDIADEEDTSEADASSETEADETAEADAVDEIQGVSNDYYSITIDNITWDEQNVTLDVTYTNNDELPAAFDLDIVDINGCRWYGGAYQNVEAGATVSATAQMRQDSNSIFDMIDAYAYVQPDEILIYPEVLNDDSDYEKSLTTPFTLYPTGLTSDEVVYPDYTPKDTDIVVIDEDDVKVVITSINPGNFKDIYYLYIQNDMDIKINCMLDDETYQENGEPVTPTSGWIEVYPGERVSSIIYLRGDDVESFSGTYIISDYDNDMWGEDPIYTGDFESGTLLMS